MAKGYAAYNLTEKARSILLGTFSPKFVNVIAHHCTHKFKVSDCEIIPETNVVKVIGYISNDDIECVVVEVLGQILKPDGNTYHITISHSNNVKPYKSNELIKNNGYKTVDPFLLEVIPTFNKF